MRSILLYLGLGICLGFSAQDDNSLEQLDWLTGTWERTDVHPGSKGYEQWQYDGTMLIGSGISMKGIDTTFVEKLRVEVIENEIYYVAEVPNNARPTLFRVTKLRPNFMQCENPEHDFPKMIVYERTGEQLKAIISAGDKGMTFLFKKID
ncbi:MAG: hypothetical protein CMB80_23610 [Flammeovirgaceae bacterium]|nr:hypothetical protein [Flammeovirgaceae bacterium]MBE63420.1 hypothetical protein [Flammeovirgaceae bacterium]MBR08324.1 hypothetical protein [Rickettsiales bacterium]HCX22829.1 hypothetical protein [Cytophagales bacterium]|tara:strand:+ start:1079 stop:1528 length:450 start_codon:yes stop_codon:yes gene_type:complete